MAIYASIVRLGYEMAWLICQPPKSSFYMTIGAVDLGFMKIMA
jgi:hypothetical protein